MSKNLWDTLHILCTHCLCLIYRYFLLLWCNPLIIWRLKFHVAKAILRACYFIHINATKKKRSERTWNNRRITDLCFLEYMIRNLWTLFVRSIQTKIKRPKWNKIVIRKWNSLFQDICMMMSSWKESKFSWIFCLAKKI